MKGIISKILISVLSILLVSGTVFLDEKLSVKAQPVAKTTVLAITKAAGDIFEKKGDKYSIKAGRTSVMVLQFKDNAVMRLAPEAAGELSVSDEGVYPRKAELNLTNGRIWLNTIESSLDFEVSTPKVKIEAEPGVFAFQYADKTLTVSAFRRSAAVSFLNKELVVPEGKEMRILESKLDNSAETIAKLRYSKLQKEFPFFKIEDADAWVEKNNEADSLFFEKHEKDVYENVRSGGPKISLDDDSVFYSAGQFVDNAKLALVFDANKRSKEAMDAAIQYFDAGVYALLLGKEDLAGKRFSQFSEMIAGVSSPLLRLALAERLDEFAFVQPDETFYDATKVLRSAARMTALENMDIAFNEVLDTAAKGSYSETEQKVVTAMRRLGVAAENNLPRVADSRATDEIFFDSVLVNDFVETHIYLLRREFLKVAELFESAHLSRISDSQEADDKRQLLISEKLKLMQAMRPMMENGDIPFQDGREAVLLLANQIELLKPTFSDTAVLSYFDDQLKAFSPFISFLRSSDASRVHGSFQESYKDFISRQDEFKQVTELLKTAVGGMKISKSRREQLAGLVSNDMAKIGAIKVKITLPDDEDDGRVKIVGGEMEGKAFTAIYDTDRKVLSDVVLDQEKIPSAIRLENFQRFILIKAGRLILPKGESIDSLTEEPQKQSNVEKVAKLALIAKLIDLDIKVDEKDITVTDVKDILIKVALAALGADDKAVTFSFDYAPDGSIISNLKVKTADKEIPVNDIFALRELPTRVDQINKQAILENQKQEELKKFLDESLLKQIEALGTATGSSTDITAGSSTQPE
ncbi:FecR domain-containing protein [Candidatus Peregrinibacteria bacterium]|nr:FecR domain-containing protein [Candidatus Peregrinibacteria bacterium]